MSWMHYNDAGSQLSKHKTPSRYYGGKVGGRFVVELSLSSGNKEEETPQNYKPV